MSIFELTPEQIEAYHIAREEVKNGDWSNYPHYMLSLEGTIFDEISASQWRQYLAAKEEVKNGDWSNYPFWMLKIESYRLEHSGGFKSDGKMPWQ